MRTLDCLPPVFQAEDFGSTRSGGGIRMHRVRVLLDDLARFRINEPAVAVADGNSDGVATGGALSFLSAHPFEGLQS